MQRLVLLAGAILAFGAIMWAGPLRPAEVSQDARFVGHFDVEQFKSTDVGKHWLQQASSTEMDAKISAFASLIGFDPRRDINAITVYGKSNQPNKLAALLRGSFDAPSMVALVQAKDTYEGLIYGKHTIHSWVDNNKYKQMRRYGAVHGSGLLVLSESQEMVQTALDVLDGRLPGLDAENAQSLQTKEFTPFFVVKADIDKIPQKCGNSAIMKHVVSGQAMLGEQAGSIIGRVVAKARDAEAAGLLYDFVNGALAFAKVNTEENPELAEVARATQLTREDDLNRLNIQASSATVIKLIDKKIADDKARREARREAWRKAAAAKEAQTDTAE